jgi:hypothetical protein
VKRICAAFLILVHGLFGGCKKESCDEVVPSVEIKDIQVSGTKTIMMLRVFDCDGDVGLAEGDTAGLLKFNAFVDIRPFRGGAWDNQTYDYINLSVQEILDSSGLIIGYDTLRDTTNFYYRVPVVNTNSRSDIYDADIDLDLGVRDFGFDTFRFEVFVRDKALRESKMVISDTRFR